METTENSPADAGGGSGDEVSKRVSPSDGFGAVPGRVLIDHAIDAFMLLDEQLRVVDVNRHACESLGYSREELIGMHPRVFDVGLDAQQIESLRQQVARGEASTFESRHRRKDGSEFPVEIRISHFVHEGRPLNLNLVRDISERKRIEQELTASEHRLDEAQRIAHCGYWERDLRSGQVTLSEEACRIFGIASGEHELDLPRWHEHWLTLIHPADREQVAAAATAAIEGGAPYDIEYRIVHEHGDVRAVHSRGEVIRDAAGRAHRIFGTIQDISELRQAELARIESEARFRIFADHASDAFMLLDEEFTILDVNRQACESLGYTREELIGMHVSRIDPRISEADVASFRAEPAGGSRIFESYHRRKDGTVFPVEIRGRVFEQGGRRYMTTSRDITERKRTEEAMLEARVAERTRIARDLHDTLLQDFQGVLLQLRTALRLFTRDPDKSQSVLATAIDQASVAIREAREAVQDLRAHPAGSGNLADSIARLGHELVRELGHEHGGRTLPTISVTVTGSERPVRANLRYDLYRVAGEALRNAYRHSCGTRIEVELCYDARHLRMRVRDDGRGIDPAILEAGGRSGHFGLRGMQERAALMRGKLAVWTAPGSGTEVELIVPGSDAYA